MFGMFSVEMNAGWPECVCMGVCRSSHSRAGGTAGFLTVQLSQTPVTVQSLFMCAVMGDHEHTGPVPCGVMVLYRGLKSPPKPHF